MCHENIFTHSGSSEFLKTYVELTLLREIKYYFLIFQLRHLF